VSLANGENKKDKKKSNATMPLPIWLAFNVVKMLSDLKTRIFNGD